MRALLYEILSFISFSCHLVLFLIFLDYLVTDSYLLVD